MDLTHLNDPDDPQGAREWTERTLRHTGSTGIDRSPPIEADDPLGGRE